MESTTAQWRVRCACLVALLMFGVACGSAMDSVSDTNLKEQASECAKRGEMNPGMAIQCGNVEKECKRRQELGRFIC